MALPFNAQHQPPSGGCVLKPQGCKLEQHNNRQPPSGGCVLKLNRLAHTVNITQSAAFGRLCVETMEAPDTEVKVQSQPPSGGCVLKHHRTGINRQLFSAAFGRLCVETPFGLVGKSKPPVSRLRAAVC